MGLDVLFAHMAGLFAMDVVEEKQEEKRTRETAVRSSASLAMKKEPPTQASLRELRGMVEQAERACRVLDEAGFCEGIGLHAEAQRGGLAQVFKEDVERFLVCVAQCDGPISADEASCINSLTGRHLSAERWSEVLERLGSNPSTFALRQPLSFMLMVYMGNRMGQDSADAYVSMYDKLGTALITADGEVVEREIETVDGYLMAFKRWAKQVDDFDPDGCWRLP